MSRIESAAKPVALALMQGQEMTLRPDDQQTLATLLCLITVRNEFSYETLRAIPKEDRDWLRTALVPPSKNWKIWVARYLGSRSNEHWCYHSPMHIDSTITAETGPDKVNTQTTTLVIGQFCAHVFSSTIIGEFSGYDGISMCRIWPPTGTWIKWGCIPTHEEPALLSLAEALGRELPTGIAKT